MTDREATLERKIEMLLRRINEQECRIAELESRIAPRAPAPIHRSIDAAIEALERATAELTATLPIEGYPDPHD